MSDEITHVMSGGAARPDLTAGMTVEDQAALESVFEDGQLRRAFDRAVSTDPEAS